jgi:hypothetical protein
MTNPDDMPEELKNMLGGGSIRKLIEMMLGGGNDAKESFFAGLSDAEKEEYKALNEQSTTRIKELVSQCFLKGCTAVGVTNSIIDVTPFGGLTAYDNHSTHVGGTLTDVCMQTAFAHVTFAPDSDNKLYCENQLKPEGIAASIFAVVATVKKVIPASFRGAFGNANDETKTLRDHMIDAVLVEFYRLTAEKSCGHGVLHYHYDMELLTRAEFDRAHLLSTARYQLPAIPVSTVSGVDFLESLTFMDEDPESGG